MTGALETMKEYTINAQGKKFGRLAVEVAHLLQGKNGADYRPNVVVKNKILITNIQGVVVTGRKYTGKLYHRHTGYMGHLKTRTFANAFERQPEKVFREAVRRMLPKNFLNQRRLSNLVFVDTEQ